MVAPRHRLHHFSHSLCELTMVHGHHGPGTWDALGIALPFSHKLCEKLRRGVGLVKLTHAPEACR
jgi:hypothetical protein